MYALTRLAAEKARQKIGTKRLNSIGNQRQTPSN